MKRIIPLLLAMLLVLSGCGTSYEEGPGISWEEYQQSQSLDSEEESSGDQDINYPAVFSMAYHKDHTLDPITCGEGIQQDVAALNLYLEHGVGQRLDYCAYDFDNVFFFFCQAFTLPAL